MLENNQNFAVPPILASGPCQGRQRAERLRRELKMPHEDDSNGPEDRETPDSVAHYIAALAGELAKIAKRNGLDTLSALLEMARLEADEFGKN